jgi:hypothetical protein
MSPLRGVALTVRFLCELAMLAALAYSGAELGSGVSAWVLAIGAPALAAIAWGTWVAPKASRPVATPTRLAIEAVIFGAAAVGLIAAGQPALGIALALAAAATSAINAATAGAR